MRVAVSQETQRASPLTSSPIYRLPVAYNSLEKYYSGMWGSEASFVLALIIMSRWRGRVSEKSTVETECNSHNNEHQDRISDLAMFRDDDIFPMATRQIITETPESDSRVNTNDDFDDIFGSAPSSPSFHPSRADDLLEDSSYISSDDLSRSGNAEISDIPRLKEKHETEGYRDGVTAGKATSVQAGFDEGYALGAVLGLKIGAILGILEGLVAGVSKMEDMPEQSGRLRKLLSDARSDLKTENVFGKEWWGEDGIWKFAVEGEGIEGKDILFPDVAKAHPLVKKWQDVVDAEMKTWGVDSTIMDMEEVTKDVEGKSPFKESQGTVMGTAKAELNW